jgi:hypothetical protein
MVIAPVGTWQLAWEIWTSTRKVFPALNGQLTALPLAVPQKVEQFAAGVALNVGATWGTIMEYGVAADEE